MTLRELPIRSRFTAPEHPGVYRLLDIEGGVAFCRMYERGRPVQMRVFHAWLEVEPIDEDRPRGGGLTQPHTRDGAAAGGPHDTSRRGNGLGRDLSRRSPEGATPGVLEHELVDPPRGIEDVLDLGFVDGLALLLAIGAIAWTMGDFPAFQGPLAFAGAVGLAVIGRIVRRRAEG